MADIDWGGLVESIGKVGVNVYQGLAQIKAQKKAAKSMAAYGYGFSGAAPMLPAMPSYGGFGFGGDLQTVSGQPVPMPMPGVESGGSSTAGRTRLPSVIMSLVNGRVVGYRSLGRPLLWSGDLSAVKRVARVRRKLGGTHHRFR